MTARRRLPVIQAPADPEVPARPPWQWALFGAGLIALGWLVLALLVAPVASFLLRRELGSWGSPDDLAARLAAASPAVLSRIALENVLLQMLALGGASLAAGAVVGKWGPGRGIVPSACAGAALAAVAVLVASAGMASPSEGASVALRGALIVVPWAAGTAALGAWRGGRTKGHLGGL